TRIPGLPTESIKCSRSYDVVVGDKSGYCHQKGKERAHSKRSGLGMKMIGSLERVRFLSRKLTSFLEPMEGCKKKHGIQRIRKTIQIIADCDSLWVAFFAAYVGPQLGDKQSEERQQKKRASATHLYGSKD